MKFKSYTIKNIVFRKIPLSLKFGCERELPMH